MSDNRCNFPKTIDKNWMKIKSWIQEFYYFTLKKQQQKTKKNIGDGYAYHY